MKRFYTLGEQQVDAAPFKRRKTNCSGCHSGMLEPSDHRDSLRKRWSGWYVTGKQVPAHHRGNEVSVARGDSPRLESLQTKFDTHAYLSQYSDVVALLVFDHQMHMMNLLARVLTAASTAEPDRSLLQDEAKELVDYLLFVDEASLPGKIQGNSGFAESFSAQGPWDHRGRSLREFDLERRLMRYP